MRTRFALSSLLLFIALAGLAMSYGTRWWYASRSPVAYLSMQYYLSSAGDPYIVGYHVHTPEFTAIFTDYAPFGTLDEVSTTDPKRNSAHTYVPIDQQGQRTKIARVFRRSTTSRARKHCKSCNDVTNGSFSPVKACVF